MSNIFPSLRGAFGSWVYYPVLFTPKQITDLIKTSQEIRESKNLDDYLQRDLTPNVKKIVNYLNQEEDRFFNSIIVGVFDGVPDWLALDLSDIDEISSEAKENLDESIGILRFNGDEKLFAIDGQHRVEAIKRRLIEDPSYDDQISVIFVPHSDNDIGKKRTRRLFSDLNKTAQKVSPGELAIIDEQDIENIVARKVYSDYSRINRAVISLSKTAPIKADDNLYFTNLLTLVKVSKVVSKYHIKKRQFKYSIEDINTVFKSVCDFFDILFDFVEGIEKSLGDTSLTKKLRLIDNQSYMRPIGLEILSAIFVQAKEANQLNSFKGKLKQADLSLNSLYFKDVIFINNRVFTKNKRLATELLSANFELMEFKDISFPDGFKAEEFRDK